jgi:KaiC/GvpD/RAD55 family RecA-like ATPase
MNSVDNTKYHWLSQFYNTVQLCQLLPGQIDALYSATQPQSVPIGSLADVDVDSYRVNSPDGFVSPAEWRNKGLAECVEIETVSGNSISASVDHFFEMASGKWKYAQFIQSGEEILTKTGTDTVLRVSAIGLHTVYDYNINHENHRYYTNNISSHNSGSGKSLVMMNIALSWLQAGLSGVYVTLELSEELTSLRTDAMLTSMSTKDIRKDINTTELKVKMIGKKSGQYRVKGLPAQSSINDIRSYLKEVQLQTGIKVDFVMVDYLDLLMPVSVKVNPNDQFIKDKYVAEELRNLAKELNVLLVTASQLNRSAVEEIEFDHSHIAGGISKINTADNVFGIFTSRAMKERGKYQIQCMKSRSSTGVGQKIDLEYNIETMRITDEGGDGAGDGGYSRKPASSLMDSIKAKSQVTENSKSPWDAPADGTHVWDKPLVRAGEAEKVTADVQSAKLKQLLGKIKSN